MIAKSLVKRCLAPVVALILWFALRLVSLSVTLSEPGKKTLSSALAVVLIGLIAWLALRAADAVVEVLERRFDVSVRDNLRARKVHTQLDVLRDIWTVVVALLVLASLLMVFDQGRQLGKTLLASAGIAGLIVGVAAQKTLATFIAGLQIALTQPIRLDDVVIIEGEWGRIEEITLTYVVVRIWDQRRLIVPMDHFIHQPFQNWTRTSADILGTVTVYADYTVKLEPIRRALKAWVKTSPLWDGRVCGLQVTGATDRAVELRVLISAADASAAWDLRCEIREKLLNFLQTEMPEALPKIRAQLSEPSGPPAGGPPSPDA